MAWPRGGCRKPRQGAGVARRSPRDPACDSGPRPCQLAAGARARTLALRPGTGRAGTAADSARTQRQDAWRPVWLGARRGPGAAASEAGQGSRTGHESSPYGLASEDAGERKERCRPPWQSAPLGVPGPESRRSPATAALAGPGGHAPRPAPPEPPSCSLLGRCGDEQVGTRAAGPGRGLPSGRSGARTRRRAASRNIPSRGPARRNLRWARGPLTGPALSLCGVNFAKNVMRQGFCGPTPHK